MFTKLEQRSWIKIEVARGRSTQECFRGLCEALVILHGNAKSHNVADITDLLRH